MFIESCEFFFRLQSDWWHGKDSLDLVLTTHKILFKVYFLTRSCLCSRYYEGGVSSVYFWDLDDGFAGVVLLKKSKFDWL